MNKLLVPKPLSAGLILSYHCNSECKHCMYFCTPKWEKNWIKKTDLEVILGNISNYICTSPYGPNNVSLNYGLHITGGEPFLNYPILLYSIKLANEFQIPSLFVETNCFWCKSDEVTREKLLELKSTGVFFKNMVFGLGFSGSSRFEALQFEGEKNSIGLQNLSTPLMGFLEQF